MNICCGCNKPVPQCTCSQEKRIAWETEARAEKQENIAGFEESIRAWKSKKGTMPAEEYEQELEWLEEGLKEWQAEPEHYEEYSFEIDDDILDTILTLWDKGYQTKFCCAGHPDGLSFMYIVFDYGYFFDFTNSGFDDNWKFQKSGTLEYYPSQKALRKMEKEGIDPYAHLCEQRDLLNQWVHQLPPARKMLPGEEIKGIWMRHRRTKKELEAAKQAAATVRS